MRRRKELLDRLAVLKKYRKQGYNYIARAEHGELRAYKEKPTKQINFWYVKGELPHTIQSSELKDVEWRDSEPLSILGEIVRIEKELKKGR